MVEHLNYILHNINQRKQRCSSTRVMNGSLPPSYWRNPGLYLGYLSLGLQSELIMYPQNTACPVCAIRILHITGWISEQKAKHVSTILRDCIHERGEVDIHRDQQCR